MKIYLAARYGRHEEMQGYAKQLMMRGHLVTSRWIWGAHKIEDDDLYDDTRVERKKLFATHDWDDLGDASMCISFTEVPKSSASRGGRHVELGIALARSKRCLVVGPRENVFHCLDMVDVYETFEKLLEYVDENL